MQLKETLESRDGISIGVVRAALASWLPLQLYEICMLDMDLGKLAEVGMSISVASGSSVAQLACLSIYACICIPLLLLLVWLFHAAMR